MQVSILGLLQQYDWCKLYLNQNITGTIAENEILSMCSKVAANSFCYILWQMWTHCYQMIIDPFSTLC